MKWANDPEAKEIIDKMFEKTLWECKNGAPLGISGKLSEFMGKDNMGNDKPISQVMNENLRKRLKFQNCQGEA